MNTKSENKPEQCYFCDSPKITNYKKISEGIKHTKIYDCPRCRKVHFIEADFHGCGIIKNSKIINDPDKDFKNKRILSILFRNDEFIETPTIKNMEERIKHYRPLDALEKMDRALELLNKKTKFVGDEILVKIDNDYPEYHCFFPIELQNVLRFLCKEGFCNASDHKNPQNSLVIASKGYERLRKLKDPGKDSRQCFVAMWLDPEMNNVYYNVIEKAIEYKEDGESEPRFKALRINNEPHLNDINDEIIAQIRRSRFMVCDLTGYRGGVYFEAGFAKGLGLKVIYTCRKDWVKETKIKCIKPDGNECENKCERVQEGIHFDLDHINRIEWKGETDDDLEKFKMDLINCIKANII